MAIPPMMPLPGYRYQREPVNWGGLQQAIGEGGNALMASRQRQAVENALMGGGGLDLPPALVELAKANPQAAPQMIMQAYNQKQAADRANPINQINARANAAKHFGLSPQDVHRYALTGDLPSPKVPEQIQQFEYGRKNPAFAEWQMSMKRAGKPETNVSVNTGETTKAAMAKEFGKEGSKYLLGKPREDAMAAQSTLENMKTARSLLSKGIIAGKGANLIASATGWGATLGIFKADDPVAQRLSRTQAYVANMGREVGNVIRAFGAGTGLSDADREYARQIAGGEIELTPDALARITDIATRLAQAKVRGYNKLIEKVDPAIMPFPLRLDEPSAEPDQMPGGGDIKILRRLD